MVDISLGNEFVAEVEESGFLAQDHDKQGQPFRWTTGHAKLVIPIDRAHPPQGLYVHLWPYRPANAEAGWLQLLVNQREMCGKEITRDQWQRTFDLGGMALGDEVVVEILSDTFVPSNLKNAGPDNRTLGLTVRDVKLLSRLDGPKN